MLWSGLNPEMVTLARETRGWTQKNLADAIGVSQATVCKYELGSKPVSHDDTLAIAKALDFVPEFFEQKDHVHSVGSSIIFHRKRVMPVKLQRRIQAEVNVRKMQVSRLLMGVSVESEHAFPSIDPDDLGSVKLVAREIRRIWRIPDGPIMNLTNAVESAGGIVILMQFGTPLLDGVHLVTPGIPPLFFMNPDVPGERFRYSLAHEIGHAVMHRSSLIDDIEREADEFASELLMPSRLIKGDLQGIDLRHAARLKAKWKVSMQALVMRAKRLGVISDSACRRLFMQMGARGMRKAEPWPLPTEEPRTYQGLVEFHRDHLGFTDEGMLSIMFTAEYGPIQKPSRRVPRLKIAD